MLDFATRSLQTKSKILSLLYKMNRNRLTRKKRDIPTRYLKRFTES
ncbi:hypothetical protein Pan241w_02370 [Gimesia alba]|uniref:Uncharacterized protein n=1 Tax=Gimesia alba TaxID=2527973 RepID=A0A517R8K3_9PLAN|nr:hypothetical protein Pan241w_02370 [Gimesia alba]